MVFGEEDEHMEEDGNGHPPVVEIAADNSGVAILTSLLRAINFCEKVNVYVTSTGMRFVVEEGKYVQAIVHLKSEVFTAFAVRELEAYGFKIPFKELLDCMKILGAEGKLGSVGSGDATDGTIAAGGGRAADACLRSLQMTYRGYGTPFCLALAEAKMVTEIELKSEELEQVMEFDELDVQWEIIMDAKLLQEFLIDLEGYAPEHVLLRIVPDNCMELRANGEAGSLKITIPKNCTGLERFCNVKEIHLANYKFSVLKHSFKLIQAADKVILKMLEGDVLNFNVVFRDTVASSSDFYAMPMANDLDDEDFSDGVDH